MKKQGEIFLGRGGTGLERLGHGEVQGQTVQLAGDPPAERRPVVSHVLLTVKVRTRYIERHPGAADQDLLTAIAFGTRISAEIVDFLTGRAWTRPEHPQTYVLCPDRTGIFILSDKNSAITYLHLTAAQTDFARVNYPSPQPPADPVQAPACDKERTDA